MSRCPYCNELLRPGQQFCRGHNLAYKRRMQYLYENNGDTTAYSELVRYGWLPQTTSQHPQIIIPVDYNFRKFGIELETVSDRESKLSEAIEFIKSFGINISTTNYTHTTTSYWKVTTDGSLSNGYGRELVSPPFSNKEQAFEEIRNLSDALNLLGVGVNVSCGFHAHFDISDLTPKQVARVIKFYQVYESEIDRLHAQSRRGQHYCQNMSGYTLDPNTISTISQLQNIFNTRYLKVNVQAYSRHGTLEFRQHCGTTNYLKIINWVKFCTRIIEYAKTENRISSDIPLFKALNLSAEEEFYWKTRRKQLSGGAA